MTDHFFQESGPGYVKHTAASKALLQIPMLGPWSLMGMQEVGPAKMHVSSQTKPSIAWTSFLTLSAAGRCGCKVA